MKKAPANSGQGPPGDFRLETIAWKVSRALGPGGGNGGLYRIRTYDPLIKSQLLYQLS